MPCARVPRHVTTVARASVMLTPLPGARMLGPVGIEVVVAFMAAVVVLAFAVDAYRRWSWRLIPDSEPAKPGLGDPGHLQLQDRQLYQDVGHTAPELLTWMHRARRTC
ncbi:MAG TPA: hypothetical protein PKH97_06020 [Tetrasphaera sp.]|uniref:hypothetical protein n=1 Tax=Nostocoides sp. TaxID=1917966 RepID=UPI002C3CD5A5|nr:hypothetical protein [Tetrasphaera sp.]HNQ06727.1 hypothetical protein [Tetrasphaera sp.]